MNLTRASKELFRRTPDECFPSLGVLSQHVPVAEAASPGNLATPADAERAIRSLTTA